MQLALRNLLTTDAFLMSLTGGRIDWGGSPQGSAVPRLVMWTISDAPADYSLSGASNLKEARVQIDCYATTYGAVKEIADRVLVLLDGYRGNGLQGVFHAGTRDTREGGTNEADRPFRISLDFLTTFTKEP